MDNPNNPPRDAKGARRKAQNHFQAAEERTNLVKQMVEKERAETDAKTVRLRAARLAKEEAERAEAKANPPPPAAPAKKSIKKKRV